MQRFNHSPLLIPVLVLVLIGSACSEESAEPAATATSEPVALTQETLANMTYRSEFTQSGNAPLENGEYSEPAAPGSATQTRVMLTEHAAFGELEGQAAAAAILVTDPGGSGTFYTLHAVITQDGQPVDLAMTTLGDRAQINSLAFQGEQIVVDMVTHGPDDPLCCPTQQVVNTYAPQIQLVETSSQIVGGGGSGSGTEIIPFDPASIAVNDSQPVLDGTCAASVAVPRAGAYRCDLENGGVGDPCFVVEGDLLICEPNPVFGSYQALVTVTEPLPQTVSTVAEPVPFFLDIGSNKPPCAKRAETFEVSGHTVTYTCQAPGAFIVGELDTSGLTWVAQYITTDTQSTQVTYGPEASDVLRAWVH